MVQISAGQEVEVSADLGVKPEVRLPGGEPPRELVVADVVAGSGVAATAGDAVSVQYAGFSWSTGAQFDASWDRGATPFPVTPLGSAPVIQGWNDGLEGARVGGRRLLVIPPASGYGAAGIGGVIAPNETLVFVVDVVGINGRS
ncbi:FKBP-type peptidyl-prolyl cis-trans isomerase [Glycomyces arizonensis]|uniref:FKBP-type peptidyl-prolyl cis-trans isomerase n=1 Tax=Glycomyces arizonensis TaxID=256035 RepID=UPI00041C99F3|nr:FKBP-type peptidyl-prolyl cis-trans isomerase [Glycomyces arizonensis]